MGKKKEKFVQHSLGENIWTKSTFLSFYTTIKTLNHVATFDPKHF